MKYIDVTRPLQQGMKKYPSDPEVKFEVFKTSSLILKNG